MSRQETLSKTEGAWFHDEHMGPLGFVGGIGAVVYAVMLELGFNVARRKVSESIGKALADSLHRYGRAIGTWSELMNRKAQTLVNSYADAYRAQLQRMRGPSDRIGTTAALARDMATLRQGERQEDLLAAHQRE